MVLVGIVVRGIGGGYNIPALRAVILIPALCCFCPDLIVVLF